MSLPIARKFNSLAREVNQELPHIQTLSASKKAALQEKVIHLQNILRDHPEIDQKRRIAVANVNNYLHSFDSWIPPNLGHLFHYLVLPIQLVRDGVSFLLGKVHKSQNPPISLGVSTAPSVLPKQKTFCFGDVHGELNGFQENLQRSKVIDDQGNWCGGTSTVIQLGDVIDRGPQSVEAFHFLDKIQAQARAHSGDVIRLLGNHELMLLMGNYQYVNFDHPENLVKEIKQAIIDGKIKAVHYDRKYLYLHGGLRTSIRNRIIQDIHAFKGADYPITDQAIADQINAILIEAVKTNQFNHPIFDVGRSRGGLEEDGGVFWSDFKDLVDSTLASNTPQIVGHTIPKPGENYIRFTNSLRLFCADAGLSSCYGGHQAFIKIKDRAITIYQKTENIWKKIKCGEVTKEWYLKNITQFFNEIKTNH